MRGEKDRKKKWWQGKFFFFFFFFFSVPSKCPAKITQHNLVTIQFKLKTYHMHTKFAIAFSF